MSGRLSPLQERVLVALAAHLREPWVLTGGAALSGFYTFHRSTRDLDLTSLDRRSVGGLPDASVRALRQDGLDAEPHRLTRDHWQVDVTDGADTVVVEVVGGWSPAVEEPRRVAFHGHEIMVESRHELLVRKLTAVFDRAEPRDLDDIGALLRAGGDLHRALRDAGEAFSGLTPTTLARALRDLPLEPLAAVVGWSAEKTREMIDLRDELVRRMTHVD